MNLVNYDANIYKCGATVERFNFEMIKIKLIF